MPLMFWTSPSIENNVTLDETILKHRALLLDCRHCKQRTNLRAQFFAQRFSLSIDLKEIAKTLVCPGCGSNEVDLVASA
jgi:Zn finger protein HypA/HybF involved in hydrogenase expression